MKIEPRKLYESDNYEIIATGREFSPIVVRAKRQDMLSYVDVDLPLEALAGKNAPHLIAKVGWASNGLNDSNDAIKFAQEVTEASKIAESINNGKYDQYISTTLNEN